MYTHITWISFCWWSGMERETNYRLERHCRQPVPQVAPTSANKASPFPSAKTFNKGGEWHRSSCYNAVVCWKTLSPGIHDVCDLTHNTRLHIVADQVDPMMAKIHPGRTVRPSTPQKKLPTDNPWTTTEPQKCVAITWETWQRAHGVDLASQSD